MSGPDAVAAGRDRMAPLLMSEGFETGESSAEAVSVSPESDAVSAADTVRWLHEEGLERLAAVGSAADSPIAAYSIDVATGVVGAYPAATTGPESEVTERSAEDLPHPGGSPGRLLIVGATASNSVLVLDLAVCQDFSIMAARPEVIARAWVLQLLLNPGVRIATNSPDLVLAAGGRLREAFIPGRAKVFSVSGDAAPTVTVTMNPPNTGPARLELLDDGTAELYFDSRFWQLEHVLDVDDDRWAALTAQLDSPAAED